MEVASEEVSRAATAEATGGEAASAIASSGGATVSTYGCSAGGRCTGGGFAGWLRTPTDIVMQVDAVTICGTGPYRSGEIATKLGRPGPESVAPTRARLIEKGLIYSPAYGLNEFTVPPFDAFIRRSFPVTEST